MQQRLGKEIKCRHILCPGVPFNSEPLCTNKGSLYNTIDFVPASELLYTSIQPWSPTQLNMLKNTASYFSALCFQQYWRWKFLNELNVFTIELNDNLVNWWTLSNQVFLATKSFVVTEHKITWLISKYVVDLASMFALKCFMIAFDFLFICTKWMSKISNEAKVNFNFTKEKPTWRS